MFFFKTTLYIYILYRYYERRFIASWKCNIFIELKLKMTQSRLLNRSWGWGRKTIYVSEDSFRFSNFLLETIKTSKERLVRLWRVFLFLLFLYSVEGNWNQRVGLLLTVSLVAWKLISDRILTVIPVQVKNYRNCAMVCAKGDVDIKEWDVFYEQLDPVQKRFPKWHYDRWVTCMPTPYSVMWYGLGDRNNNDETDVDFRNVENLAAGAYCSSRKLLVPPIHK